MAAFYNTQLRARHSMTPVEAHNISPLGVHYAGALRARIGTAAAPRAASLGGMRGAMPAIGGKLRAFAVNTLLASVVVPVSVRVAALRAMGVSIGEGSRVHPGCNLSNTDLANLANVSIGSRTYINSGCFFESLHTISIGSNVSLAMEVMLCTSTHRIGPPERRAGDSVPAPIVIEDGCWLGLRAIVLPGVTIARGCVVAAGAVVTSDCAPDGLYAGVPARRIRDL